MLVLFLIGIQEILSIRLCVFTYCIKGDLKSHLCSPCIYIFSFPSHVNLYVRYEPYFSTWAVIIWRSKIKNVFLRNLYIDILLTTRLAYREIRENVQLFYSYNFIASIQRNTISSNLNKCEQQFLVTASGLLWSHISQ